MKTTINGSMVHLFFPYPSKNVVEIYFENGESFQVSADLMVKLGINLSTIPYKR